MEDYYTINYTDHCINDLYGFDICFYKKNILHKLIGPASISYREDIYGGSTHQFYFEGYSYLDYLYINNTMYIKPGVLQLIDMRCEFYIKENILRTVKTHNPIIELSYLFLIQNNLINELPGYIKDLIIV